MIHAHIQVLITYFKDYCSRWKTVFIIYRPHLFLILNQRFFVREEVKKKQISDLYIGMLKEYEKTYGARKGNVQSTKLSFCQW
jgi:hypothetical protein